MVLWGDKLNQSKPTFLMRLGKWCLGKIKGQRGTLRAIEQKTPQLYWLIQSGQAGVIASPEGDVKALRLAFQPIHDADLAFLRDLPKLSRLELLYCPNVTNKTLEYLSNSTELKVVKLDGTGVSGFGLRYLLGNQNLEALSLDQTMTGTTSVDDLNSIAEDDPEMVHIIQTCGMSYLGGFPRLCELHLNCQYVGDGAMEGVAKARNLKSLLMAGVQVSNEGLKFLYGHPNLKTFLVFGPNVTDDARASLKEHLPPGCKVH
ncbi:MAG: hypothetical protein KDA84_07055 [Planctomycetaceae bacterium]|nr:hypothetical protein [Planctomycetaceae bacterium]